MWFTVGGYAEMTAVRRCIWLIQGQLPASTTMTNVYSSNNM